MLVIKRNLICVVIIAVDIVTFTATEDLVLQQQQKVKSVKRYYNWISGRLECL